MVDASPEQGQLKAGDLTIDYDRRRVVRGDKEIRLTPKEFELLSLLAHNHDRVLTHPRSQGGLGTERRQRAPLALVAQLRRKSKSTRAIQSLLSEPWVGYRFSTGN
jgi:two-component system KDP operon response regulator KdpE